MGAPVTADAAGTTATKPGATVQNTLPANPATPAQPAPVPPGQKGKKIP
jgi:hypothetical protein